VNLHRIQENIESQKRDSSLPMRAMIAYFLIFTSVSSAYVFYKFHYFAYIYFTISIFSYYLVYFGYSIIGKNYNNRKIIVYATKEGMNLSIIVLSIIGIFLIYYDRTAIRGIDYSGIGIAAARAEINRLGERGGVLSVVGNLLSVSIYLPFINLIFDWEKWDKRKYLIGMLVIFGLAGLTYLTAGRTVILIAIALVSTAILGRGVTGRPLLPNFLSVRRVFALAILTIFIFGLIFSLRAEAFGAANSAEYLGQLCVHLSQPAPLVMMKCSDAVSSTGIPFLDDFLNYGTAVILYAVHIVWIGDVIAVDTNFGQITTFIGLQDLFLSRFGFVLQSTNYDGYFIPASHGMIFDFGYIATAIFLIISGLIWKISQYLMMNGSITFGRVIFCYVGAALILSVLISASNLPFYVLSLGIILVMLTVQRVFIRRPSQGAMQPPRTPI
jgi:hypothetical protein